MQFEQFVIIVMSISQKEHVFCKYFIKTFGYNKITLQLICNLVKNVFGTLKIAVFTSLYYTKNNMLSPIVCVQSTNH